MEKLAEKFKNLFGDFDEELYNEGKELQSMFNNWWFYYIYPEYEFKNYFHDSNVYLNKDKKLATKLEDGTEFFLDQSILNDIYSLLYLGINDESSIECKACNNFLNFFVDLCNWYNDSIVRTMKSDLNELKQLPRIQSAIENRSGLNKVKKSEIHYIHR